MGGLVGYNEFLGVISNCYSTGYTISMGGSWNVGGITRANYEIIENCFYTGTISGACAVGGIVGFNYAILKNSYSTGSVYGNDCAGGLVGANIG